MTIFFEVEHRYDNQDESFERARVNKAIIYVTMHKRKAPITILPSSKVLETQQFAVTSIQKKYQ